MVLSISNRLTLTSCNIPENDFVLFICASSGLSDVLLDFYNSTEGFDNVDENEISMRTPTNTKPFLIK